MNNLNHHVRQYRHNNNDGLVVGYDRKGIENFVSCLESEIAKLKKQVEDLTLPNAGVNSRLTNSVALRNAVVEENNGLKCQVELLWHSLEFINNFTLEFSDKKQFDKLYEWGVCSSSLLTKTRRQCLANVKADAVKDFMNHIQYSEDDGLIDEEYIKESFDFWLKIREDANDEPTPQPQNASD